MTTRRHVDRVLLGLTAAAVALFGDPVLRLLAVAAAVGVVIDAGLRHRSGTVETHVRSVLLDMLAIGLAGISLGAPMPAAALVAVYAAITASRLLDGRRAVALVAAGALGVGGLLFHAFTHGASWSGDLIPVVALATGVAVPLLAVGRERERRLQALAAAAANTKAAQRAKTDFLRNMSHEIRTPMNAVIGMAELMLESERDADQRAHLDVIRSAAHSLLAQINDLLDLSWLEAGTLVIEQSRFRVRSTIADTLETHRESAAAKGLRIDLQVSSGVPDTVVGDPGRLRQILSTLVSNAVKFTHEGAVWINVAVVEQGEEHRLLVSVQDTGIGIPSHLQSAIFEPFEQADPSLTRAQGGTGVGLAIASRLAGLMGGTLDVSSRPGAGSTFTVNLPVGLVPVDAGDGSVERSGAAEGTAVLVVSSGRERSDKLAAALEDAGLCPFTVTSTDEAMAVLRTAGDPAFPVMVLDVDESMRLAAKIRTVAAPDQTKIVLLTIAGQRGDAARARRHGLSAYLTGTTSPQTVVTAVRTALATPIDGPLITRHSIREATTRRVLVADDSPTNRRIAAAMLTRRGWEVAEASDGAEALEAWEEQPIDVILMDVQMPNIDGLTATEEIRRREAGTGSRVPIIALTAHAMASDREACMAAGMDDYLTKPLQLDLLIDTVERAGREPPRPGTAVLQAVPGAPFDRETALEMAGGDRELLDEILRTFLSDCPDLLTEIERGVAAGAPERVCNPAHRLKGELAAIGAAAPSAAAARLENAAKDADLGEIGEAWQAFQTQMDHLVDALSAHCNAA